MVVTPSVKLVIFYKKHAVVLKYVIFVNFFICEDFWTITDTFAACHT